MFVGLKIPPVASILNVLSIYVMIEMLLNKMYIEGALVIKSCNITLSQLVSIDYDFKPIIYL